MKLAPRQAARAAMVVAPMLVAQLASGHGIELFAAVEGNEIRGTLEYHGGTPIADAPVRAYAPDGEIIVQTTSGEDGSFVLPVSRRCDYRIVGDAGEGHLGSHTIPESDLPPAGGAAIVGEGDGSPIPADGLEARIQSAVSKELAPLKRQLAEYEQKTRFSDVLGGIGYLFGLAGIVALLKSRNSSGA